tara:strand:- start:348 stop:806 length:459 start_codon:yes stop_codon:yes gene_type:complete
METAVRITILLLSTLILSCVHSSGDSTRSALIPNRCQVMDLSSSFIIEKEKSEIDGSEKMIGFSCVKEVYGANTKHLPLELLKKARRAEKKNDLKNIESEWSKNNCPKDWYGKINTSSRYAICISKVLLLDSLCPENYYIENIRDSNSKCKE